MEQPKYDPGLTQQYAGPLRRAVNRDGTFNVIRRGTDWRDVHPYLHLVSVSWASFFGFVLVAYVLLNLTFAAVYFALGPDALEGGSSAHSALDRFLRAFFFSSQTLTTVGFGAISPKSNPANFIAGLEALVGLMSFAVATGLLFGRVSRPSARLGFSEHALIAPYQDGSSLQFRIVNRRSNSVIELEVTAMLMGVRRVDGTHKRVFELLPLERSRIQFLALTWTVVHPIDAASPLFEKSLQDLSEMEAEIIVTVKAWDETFSQTVFQRFSYRWTEIVRGQFKPAFRVNHAGAMELEVGNVGLYEPAAPTALSAET